MGEREAAALVITLAGDGRDVRQCGRRFICWVADYSRGAHVARPYCDAFRSELQGPHVIRAPARN
jgi:hypothetical protein